MFVAAVAHRLYGDALLRSAVKKGFGVEERNEKVSPQIMFESFHTLSFTRTKR